MESFLFYFHVAYYLFQIYNLRASTITFRNSSRPVCDRDTEGIIRILGQATEHTVLWPQVSSELNFLAPYSLMQ